MMRIEKILLYPVKSMAGYPVDTAECTKDGLIGDRQFVVTRPDGKFLTARQFPALLTLKPRWLDSGTIEIQGPDGSIQVTPPAQTNNALVSIWSDTVDATDCGDDVATWLTDFLGKPARLCTIPKGAKRISGKNAHAPDSFADAMPLLVLSQESIDEISSRLTAPVSWQNFRPNILVSGVEQPFGEDFWASVQAGAVKLETRYGCSRCVMTTVHPETGTFRRDKEPMQTLRTYRKAKDRQIYVGQNAIVRTNGPISVGDQVTVLETRDRNILQAEGLSPDPA